MLFALFLFTASCVQQEQKIFNEAQSEVEKGHFRIAASLLEKITIRSPNSENAIKAAREAARISFFEIKDFEKAAKFYQQIVLSSKSSEERLLAQKQIASIYFDHLTDYPRAVIEINKLIIMLTDTKERTEFKMKLARAYYYQNNFTQAENEVDEFLKSNPPEDQKFDMIFLKGNITLAKKDMLKAMEIFKSLIRDYQERSVKENVVLTLSVCYEELKDFKGAIEALEKARPLYPNPEYVDIRIKRLKDRLGNQPGAHGRVRK